MEATPHPVSVWDQKHIKTRDLSCLRCFRCFRDEKLPWTLSIARDFKDGYDFRIPLLSNFRISCLADVIVTSSPEMAETNLVLKFER